MENSRNMLTTVREFIAVHSISQYCMVSTKDTEMRWSHPLVSSQLTRDSQEYQNECTHKLFIENVCIATTNTFRRCKSSLITYNTYYNVYSVKIDDTVQLRE